MRFLIVTLMLVSFSCWAIYWGEGICEYPWPNSAIGVVPHPSPTQKQLRFEFDVGNWHKNHLWDVRLAIDPCPHEVWMLEPDEERDAEGNRYVPSRSFYAEPVSGSKPVMVWQDRDILVDGKVVCRAMLPKTKVASRKWVECRPGKCTEKTSPVAKELLVPNFWEYGYYAMDSTELSPKACPLDYDFPGDTTHKLISYQYVKKPGFVGTLGHGGKMYYVVLTTGDSVFPANLSSRSESICDGRWARAKPEQFSSWDYTVKFNEQKVNVEDMQVCRGEGRKACLKGRVWLKELLCEGAKCPEGEKWDELMEELQLCMTNVVEGTKRKALHGKKFRCKTDDKGTIVKMDYPEAFWRKDVLDYHPDKFDKDNPIVIVPEIVP